MVNPSAQLFSDGSKQLEIPYYAQLPGVPCFGPSKLAAELEAPWNAMECHGMPWNAIDHGTMGRCCHMLPPISVSARPPKPSARTSSPNTSFQRPATGRVTAALSVGNTRLVLSEMSCTTNIYKYHMQWVDCSMLLFIFKALAVGSRRGLSRRASMKPHLNMLRTTSLRCCHSVRQPNCFDLGKMPSSKSHQSTDLHDLPEPTCTNQDIPKLGHDHPF